ncbi:MAG: hypothetical protein ACM30H_00450 [Clostridia bacterium]
MRTIVFCAAALFAAPALATYDANGVALGGSEKDVKKAFPSALCKPLEWKSSASDRRCDDAKIVFAGVEARITVYLKSGIVQAFDVGFNTTDLDKVVAQLKVRYGKPESEAKDVVERAGKEPRTTYKVFWQQGKDRASLVVPMEKKRAQLTVSRGNWEEEIYRVR